MRSIEFIPVAISIIMKVSFLGLTLYYKHGNILKHCLELQSSKLNELVLGEKCKYLIDDRTVNKTSS